MFHMINNDQQYIYDKKEKKTYQVPIKRGQKNITKFRVWQQSVITNQQLKQKQA